MGISLALALLSSSRWKKRSSKVMRRVRGRKRLRREDNFVAPEIPLDLLIEIMTRLSAKSLMRFKCVSKLWLSLILSRYFSNLYRLVASPTRSPRLYIILSNHFGCDSMEVCHNPGKSVLISLSPSSTSNNAESFDQDLAMPGMGGFDMMIIRGLILYTVCRKACIYNPTTRQSLTLPSVKSNLLAQEAFYKDVNYFLGYDPVLDQYKVLCTVAIEDVDERMITEHWVFVLEVGGSWKRIEFNQPHEPTNLVLCINGVIYYSAFTSMSTHIILSFDITSEEFSLIQAPDVGFKFVEFIEYGGRPTFFHYKHLIKKGMVELWVLEDGGKWNKKSLVLPHSQMHLVENAVVLEVQGTTKNGEVILTPKLISPFYILYYNLEKNVLRKVEIGGISDYSSEFFYNLKLLDNSESIMHLEI